MNVPSPPATMFAWARIPAPFADMKSLEFSELLLKEADIAVSPGIGFGEYGDDYVRLALVENEQRIRQAGRSLKRFMDEHLKEEIRMSSNMRIGLAGLGTVGATVAGVCCRAQCCAPNWLRFRPVTQKDRGVDLSSVDFVATPLDLVSHDKVDVVVELIGGENGIALDLVEAALEKGKPVSRRIRPCWPSMQRVYLDCQSVAMCHWPLRRQLRAAFPLSKPCAKGWPEMIFTAFAVF